jgi:hypothetical protein
LATKRRWAVNAWSSRSSMPSKVSATGARWFPFLYCWQRWR